MRLRHHRRWGFRLYLRHPDLDPKWMSWDRKDWDNVKPFLTYDGQNMWRTTPGSALLFPSQCAPTGDLPDVETTRDRVLRETRGDDAAAHRDPHPKPGRAPRRRTPPQPPSPVSCPGRTSRTRTTRRRRTTAPF